MTSVNAWTMLGSICELLVKTVEIHVGPGLILNIIKYPAKTPGKIFEHRSL